MSFLFGEIESEDLNLSAVGGGLEGDRSQCEKQGAREGVAVEMHRANERGKHFGHRKRERRTLPNVLHFWQICDMVKPRKVVRR